MHFKFLNKNLLFGQKVSYNMTSWLNWQLCSILHLREDEQSYKKTKCIHVDLRYLSVHHEVTFGRM